MWEGGIMKRLISGSLITASLLVVLLSVPSIASADGTDPTVHWTLTGVTFSDTVGGPTSGSASGSFDFNATTDMFSNISITSTSGNSYSTISPVFTSGLTSLWLGSTSSDLTGTALLSLLFDNNLVNTGGTVTDPLTLGLLGGGEGTCNDAGCSNPVTNFITGGAATSTVVTTPEPSTLSLLGVALAGFLALTAIRKAV